MMIVIGGSSYIGQKICKHFSEKGQPFIGTYCNSKKEGLQYFNLEQPNLNKLDINLKKTNYAIICSAITKPDECKKNEEKSYKINVTGTKKLIQQIFEKGIIPIIFSSEYVFNGEKGNYTEKDKKNPNTIYGRQKKEIEDFLLESGKPFLITRLSKVFGLTPKDKTLLTSTIEQLQNNETLYCATDQVFSPTYVQDLMQVLDLMMGKKLQGLYNLASPESFNRFELTNILKSQLKIKSGKIIPCSIRDFNFLDSRPLNTSLNLEKIIIGTEFKFTEIRTCIEKLKRIYNLTP